MLESEVFSGSRRDCPEIAIAQADLGKPVGLAV